MNLRTFLSTSLFLIFLLASCNEKEEKQHALPAPMEEIDTTSMKKSLLHEIKNYVNQYDSCNAFLLYPTFFYKLDNDQDYYDDFKYNEIFCIGKISSASFGDSEFRLVDHYPHRYFKKIIAEKSCPREMEYRIEYHAKWENVEYYLQDFSKL